MKITNVTDLEHSQLIRDLMGDVVTEKVWVYREHRIDKRWSSKEFELKCSGV